jgi:phosphoserine phosphatase RsbU/P
MNLGIKWLDKIRNYLRGDEESPIMHLHALIAIIGSITVLLILQYKDMPLSVLQHSLLVLVEKTCVIVVIAYVISRLSVFNQVLEGKFTFKNQFILVMIFGGISIFGTYSGVDVFGAMANVRDLAPMVAGLIGGPIMGVGAGLIGGIYRYSLGGFTALPCALSTVLAGFLAGIFFLINKRQFVGVWLAVIFAALIESLHMILALSLSSPYSQALIVVKELSLPMIFSNALGMFVFALIITNRQREIENSKNQLSLDDLNGGSGIEFSEDDVLIAQQLQENIRKNKTLLKSIKINPKSKVKKRFYQIFDEEIQKIMERNTKFYEKVKKTQIIKKPLVDKLFEIIYNNLKRE